VSYFEFLPLNLLVDSAISENVQMMKLTKEQSIVIRSAALVARRTQGIGATTKSARTP
jgi:hypothetical protein